MRKLPRLDCSNATLAGLAVSQLRRLQSVLTCCFRKTDMSFFTVPARHTVAYLRPSMAAI